MSTTDLEKAVIYICTGLSSLEGPRKTMFWDFLTEYQHEYIESINYNFSQTQYDWLETILSSPVSSDHWLELIKLADDDDRGKRLYELRRQGQRELEKAQKEQQKVRKQEQSAAKIVASNQ